MTRLTPDVIKGIPETISSLDTALERIIGADLRHVACSAAGISTEDICFESYTVAVVPVTSGKGVITGFSESVSAAVREIGMNSFVTEGSDVTGTAEAYRSGADIIFMADDENFIAINTKARMFTDNIRSTAKGYVAALKCVEGDLAGKKVLVLGAGRVGTVATEILLEQGATVEVSDIVWNKALVLERKHRSVRARADLEKAIQENRLILNASPGKIPGKLIQEGAVISSPGVPYAFDSEGEAKAKIIHDVLSLGVAVMAVSSAVLSPIESRAAEICGTGAIAL